MGCLQVYTENRTVRDISVDAAGVNDVPVVTVIPVQTEIGVECKGMNTILVITTEDRNPVPVVSAESANARIKVSVGLVCQVALGKYRVFYVENGPFLVEEGYFKVIRS